MERILATQYDIAFCTEKICAKDENQIVLEFDVVIGGDAGLPPSIPLMITMPAFIKVGRRTMRIESESLGYLICPIKSSP